LQKAGGSRKLAVNQRNKKLEDSRKLVGCRKLAGSGKLVDRRKPAGCRKLAGSTKLADKTKPEDSRKL
jgi:hypothetical protein